MAFFNALELFELMAFMTIVEPSVIVRTNIFETSPKDQRKASAVVLFLQILFQDGGLLFLGPKLRLLLGGHPAALRPRRGQRG